MELVTTRAQEDPRIYVLEAHLERDELLAMFGCYGEFLSLHRSEGFGRVMLKRCNSAWM